MSRLALVEELEREALERLHLVVSHNPVTDSEVIQEFANIARLRELATQLGWEELPDLDGLYRLRAEHVRTIIAKEVGSE